MIQVHNISPYAVWVGSTKIRPGKMALVRTLSDREASQHGKTLWIGEPPKRTHTSAEGPPMTSEEARRHLSSVSDDSLRHFCESMIPPLKFSAAPSRPVLEARILGALFQVTRILDPVVFSWLRRWTKNGSAYVERIAP